MDTPFREGEPAGAADQVAQHIPAGRVGTPDDVAAAVRHLVSAGAGCITGQVVHVNGGWWPRHLTEVSPRRAAVGER